MKISKRAWNSYITKLRKINDKAVSEVEAYLARKGGFENMDRTSIIDYAYYISNKYGCASATLSAEMYDAIAELSGVYLPSALPAETASYSEVAKTVNGIIKNTGNNKLVAQGVGRLVKMAGTDTILENAHRDRKGRGSKRKHTGAEVAWIPSGDTCPFCLMLASQGWVKQTEWGANSHSEHIHANCDCTYAVRFTEDTSFEGYDPSEYRKVYDNAEGDTPEEKLNYMRREHYAEHKDEINAQQRAAYAERKARTEGEGI